MMTIWIQRTWDLNPAAQFCFPCGGFVWWHTSSAVKVKWDLHFSLAPITDLICQELQGQWRTFTIKLSLQSSQFLRVDCSWPGPSSGKQHKTQTKWTKARKGIFAHEIGKRSGSLLLVVVRQAPQPSHQALLILVQWQMVSDSSPTALEHRVTVCK